MTYQVRMTWLALCIVAADFAGFGHRHFSDQAACGVASAADADKWMELRSFTRQYCVSCHHADATTEVEPAGARVLDLDAPDLWQDELDPVIWERIVQKLRSYQMPPLDADVPDQARRTRILSLITANLDRQAVDSPFAGSPPKLRRMTRTEYGNAVRDLLGVHVDATELLPPDESSHGFDNITVTSLSPALMDRYISAAQTISRMAVGGRRETPESWTWRVPADLTQEEHFSELPVGTRGGVLVDHHFPENGQYEVEVRLARDRNEEVEGLRSPQELEILLDLRRMSLMTVVPPPDNDHSQVDAGLKSRFPVTAGRHSVGVTFIKQPTRLLETLRQPGDAHFNMHRHPRQSPAVFQVSITGPWTHEGAATAASCEELFICRPATEDDEPACVEQILRPLMRRAYRRPVRADDLVHPMRFYQRARLDGSFEDGIRAAVAAVLVSPSFLFRMESLPKKTPLGNIVAVAPFDFASRLSFFLWSSLPDDELLDAVERGHLDDPSQLEQQVHRMLRDERANALVTSFADQWLHLRNLDSIVPDARLFPDFDDNLRQAFRRETQLHFQRLISEDLSVLELIRSPDTFVNQRLARHYGIPHVYGSRFRRIELPAVSPRGGLLRQGSVLTVTSYATRTSPVLRGHWILKTLLDAAPPPPPPNVPALADTSVDAALPIRARLAQHRGNPACASCHCVMDPVGFALEDYDAIGRWRETDAGSPVDSAGAFPGHAPFAGVSGLEQVLLRHPEQFAGTMASRLLTYATGRGMEERDAPAIRQIVREAALNNYRFSALILAIVRSPAFRMRTVTSDDVIATAND